MSENFLRLIPTDPPYVPNAVIRQQARDVFASFVPQADEVSVRVTDEEEFVDQGANLERILCPACGRDLDMQWWAEAMDEAYYETKFARLMITMPCCGATCSLNDLVYEWPAGFARFVLEARNPNADVNEDQKDVLEQLLQCELRKIWAHI